MKNIILKSDKRIAWPSIVLLISSLVLISGYQYTENEKDRILLEWIRNPWIQIFEEFYIEKDTLDKLTDLILTNTEIDNATNSPLYGFYHIEGTDTLFLKIMDKAFLVKRSFGWRPDTSNQDSL